VQIESQNWNALWESNFEPVDVDGRVMIRAPFHAPSPTAEVEVVIMPKMSFGTGHHATTKMMVQMILASDVREREGLDMGCGTGVLGIMAKKCGAERVVAVDIDDKSVNNSLENAQTNDVELDVRLGSTPPDGEYDLILANIHRNILIEHMPAYAKNLKEDGELWLSGFYKEDIAYLTQAAEKEGLIHTETKCHNEWQWLRMKK
jgi:ribosomal protein L11 methyltransferase